MQPASEPEPIHKLVSGDPPSPAEVELWAAFDRLSPQGTTGWALADSLRRLGDAPANLESSAPWHGLPDDLWERGRAATASRRLMGDVIDALAVLMDANTRAIVGSRDSQLHDRLTAAWDAIRYLAANLEKIETAIDPMPSLLVEPHRLVGAPDVSAWADVVAEWFAAPSRERPILMGESVGVLAQILRTEGHRVQEAEPKASDAWATAAACSTGDIFFGGLAAMLDGCAPSMAAGALLAGSTDHLALPGKIQLLQRAVDAVGPAGTVVVLTTDRAEWEESLTPLGRDLVRGAPLHPDTWVYLLGRLGVVDAQWHRPSPGPLHAVLGRLP